MLPYCPVPRVLRIVINAQQTAFVPQDPHINRPSVRWTIKLWGRLLEQSDVDEASGGPAAAERDCVELGRYLKNIRFEVSASTPAGAPVQTIAEEWSTTGRTSHSQALMFSRHAPAGVTFCP